MKSIPLNDDGSIDANVLMEIHTNTGIDADDIEKIIMYLFDEEYVELDQ